MISYPILKKNATIGVTAPSSGLPEELFPLLKMSSERMEARGFTVVIGETAWKQYKAKSASATERADELNQMMADEKIDLIIPPWGGELLIEMLEYIDFEQMKPKWILGYSDISLLLLAITLKTGMATAHGTNLVDLRGEWEDDTTAMWHPVLTTQVGNEILQHSSPAYQIEWQHENPSPCIFHLTEQTAWKSLLEQPVEFQGRLLGGCIDVIRHLMGTPYGDVSNFSKQYIHDEPIIWYFENCELSTTDLRRTLVQMKLAGWFANCAGIMFGRSVANISVDDYTAIDVYQDLWNELQIPIIYDIDCGHAPPQNTLINGAYAEVTLSNDRGTILQRFV
ncbi:S66 peptidase family protein [Sporosarcina sp.]|uniref:S66 family peptidase n=1 Tax=Sporosarcina sp. TaxID=49982 RepID=UPI00260F3FE6|nr:S66 peptidase family protein [Sporosarcina sp.]